MSNLYIDNNPRFLTNVVGVYAMRNINIFGIIFSPKLKNRFKDRKLVGDHYKRQSCRKNTMLKLTYTRF